MHKKMFAIVWQLFYFLIVQPIFLRKVNPLNKAPFSLFRKGVAMQAGLKVLMEVDDTSSLIVGDPQGILDQHPRA
jgi:hypothetical protein